MSSITQAIDAEAIDAEALDRSIARDRSDVAGDRTRRWITFVVTGLVVAFSVVEVINLSLRHTTGAELYGILVAVVAAAAGIANLALLRSGQPHTFITIAILALWAVVALGGVGGTVAHIIGPVADHGPVDLRPRPIAAPLIFSLLGLVGGLALYFGQRARSRRVIEPGKE